MLFRSLEGAGQDFSLGVQLLICLNHDRQTPDFGCTGPQLARQTHSDPLRVADLLDRMVQWGWVRRLEDEPTVQRGEEGGPLYALLADPSLTPAQPLLETCLAAPSPAWAGLRERWMWSRLTLSDLMR